MTAGSNPINFKKLVGRYKPHRSLTDTRAFLTRSFIGGTRQLATVPSMDPSPQSPSFPNASSILKPRASTAQALPAVENHLSHEHLRLLVIADLTGLDGSPPEPLVIHS